MRCVITGAAGYVARFVISELEQSHELTLVSRRALDTRHRLLIGDILAEDDCLRALQGAEVLVHIAAVPDPSPETFTVNTLSTYRLLEAARVHDVGRVVMASSNCVYGHCYRQSGSFVPDYVPIDEAHPCRPEDNYGLSKVVCEEVLRSYGRAHSLQVAALRLAWVWGDREHEWWLREGRKEGDAYGEALWAYVDARDAARAFRLAVEAEHLPSEPTYNVNADDTMADEDSAVIAARVLPHLGTRAEPLVGRASFFSNDRARTVLGWKPKHSWVERVPA